MSDIQRLVEYLVPLLFPEGPGPYWVSVSGWAPATFPEPEEGTYFDFYRGPFGQWWPGPDCQALVVVAPCTTNATGHLYLRRQCGTATRRSGRRWHRGVIYFGLSRDGDHFAVEVGDDGPRTMGAPSGGAFIDAVRAKFGLPALMPGAGDDRGWTVEQS